MTSDSVISDSSSLSHTFVTEGNYTIILNATNENGSDSTYVTITVLEAPDPSIPILPEAKFSENVTSGYVPLTIQFFDFSENAASLSWNFGDGKKSCCPNPKHTFCCPGNYTVSLTAKNENGSSSACITIKVLEPINQSFTGDTVDPENAIGSSSSQGSESTSIKETLGRIKLGSVRSFVLSFTGTR
jgi:PKD repeat protein